MNVIPAARGDGAVPTKTGLTFVPGSFSMASEHDRISVISTSWLYINGMKNKIKLKISLFF